MSFHLHHFLLMKITLNVWREWWWEDSRTIPSKMFGPIFGDPIKDLFGENLVSSFKPLKNMHVKSESCDQILERRAPYSLFRESMSILNFRAWHKISAANLSLLVLVPYSLRTVVSKNMFPNDLFASETFGPSQSLPLTPMTSSHELGSQTSVLTQWQSAVPWRLPANVNDYRTSWC